MAILEKCDPAAHGGGEEARGLALLANVYFCRGDVRLALKQDAMVGQRCRGAMTFQHLCSMVHRLSHVALQQAKPEVAEEELNKVLGFYCRLLDEGGMPLPDLRPDSKCSSNLEMLARLLEIKGSVEDLERASAIRCDVAETKAIVESLWRAGLEEARRGAWEAKDKASAELEEVSQGNGVMKKKAVGNNRKKKKKRPYRKQEGGFSGTLEVEWGPEGGDSNQHSSLLPARKNGTSVNSLIEVMQGLDLGKVASDCSVCVGPLEEKEGVSSSSSTDTEIVQLICCHRYHASCLSCWKAVSQSHNLPYSCPRCRKVLIISK